MIALTFESLGNEDSGFVGGSGSVVEGSADSFDVVPVNDDGMPTKTVESCLIRFYRMTQ